MVDECDISPTVAEVAPAVEQQCSICLLDVLPNQHRATAHPDSGCRHSFHWPCLADALALSSTCPNCRRPYHVHGVYEISPQGDSRLHIPDARARSPRPDDGATMVEHGALGRCCQHKLALPAVVLVIALPILVLFAIKMTKDA